MRAAILMATAILIATLMACGGEAGGHAPGDECGEVGELVCGSDYMLECQKVSEYGQPVLRWHRLECPGGCVEGEVVDCSLEGADPELVGAECREDATVGRYCDAESERVLHCRDGSINAILCYTQSVTCGYIATDGWPHCG